MAAQKTPQKKKYTSPCVRCYGDISVVTQTTTASGTFLDALPAIMKTA